MALREDLHTWLVSLDAWQQDLAKRLAGRPGLDGADYDEALRAVKAAFGALGERESAPTLQELVLDDLPDDEPSRGAPRLVGLGRLRGVGAVSDGQELRFAAEGLTVIYGQNAAGKSTYVRALKRVCRTVDCDAEVLGNVFATASTTAVAPAANVTVIVDGQLRARQLGLADPADVGLDAVSVFDAHCAELYLDAQNAVAYMPPSLRLLARMAATQDQMRRDLQAEINRLSRQAPSFPEFEAPSSVKTFIAGLSATTHVDEAQDLATISEHEQRRLAELRAVLASSASHGVRADAQAAQQDANQARALAEQLRELSTQLQPRAADALRHLANEAAAADEAVELAARQFGGLPIATVGSDPWQRLWQAAREFGAQSSADFPPAAGQDCPLCLQEMTTGAADRLAHFERYIRSAVGERARSARAALNAALEPLAERHVDACRTPFLIGLTETGVRAASRSG